MTNDRLIPDLRSIGSYTEPCFTHARQGCILIDFCPFLFGDNDRNSLAGLSSGPLVRS